MPAGELTGLIATVALLAAVIGGFLALAASGKHRRQRREHREKLDLLSRWLAARLTLSRNALSFVSALRTLAESSPDSTFHALRTEEAHSARDRLHRALSELDRAEAVVLVHFPRGDVFERMARLERIGAEALRAVVNGNDRLCADMTHRLRHQDQAAIELVREAAQELQRRPLQWAFRWSRNRGIDRSLRQAAARIRGNPARSRRQPP